MRRSPPPCTIPASRCEQSPDCGFREGRRSVGLPAGMEDSPQADDFIPAGLASLGIEADEVEMAVMGAVHQIFWPPIRELLSFDTSEVMVERNPDLSQGP